MSNSQIRPFHLAFPVTSITKTINWYVQVLGCTIGRKSENWVDFNFFGHQISAHKVQNQIKSSATNPVDGHNIPSRHFGIILKMNQWDQLCDRLTNLNINFIIEPNTRFKGEKGEQATFFIQDPSKNVLEFKTFKNDNMIFEHQ
tara:strand:+ start:244 stop:675 length:432 start_codon:yes stop_codon:yes gene_type:complete